jgi:hypothetical protein
MVLMSTKPGMLSRKITVPKFGYAFAVSALALGAVVSVAPARAATVTDIITFSDTGTYATDGDPTHGYTTGTASGSFQITFDPTQQYLTQSITGIISGLTYSVTDPYFSGSPLPLNPIAYFAFDGAGALTLSSDPTLSKSFFDTIDITIGINGWAYGTASSVWYAQDQYGHTLTANGTATITEQPLGAQLPGETPLPAALPLFATGLGAMGLLGWRRKRKGAAALAAA